MITIDGEVLRNDPSKEEAKTNTPLETPPAVASENPHQVISYNPLAAEPAQFSKSLARHQENYDNLALHLQSVLVPGKDFGRVHFVKECKDKYRCTDPYHWSKDDLLAPGADKILGLLGLSVHYPGIEAYKTAALEGIKITDVITDAQVLGHSEQIMAEGVGGASRSEFKGDLNRTMKRAQKRARVEAVKRLPSISALFQDERWIAEVYRNAAKSDNNSINSRAQQVNQKWDTGAVLTEWPKGGKLAGQKFADMEDSALDWICTKCQNDPDIFKAAKLEIDRRQGTVAGSADVSAEGEPSVRHEAPPTDGIPSGAVTNDYDDYPEAQ